MAKRVMNHCYHCKQSAPVLIILNPTPDLSKVLCVPCFFARHPQSSLELLEQLLDLEVKRDTQAEANFIKCGEMPE